MATYHRHHHHHRHHDHGNHHIANTTALCQAIVQLLSGVLNLDATVFVWDQCLLVGCFEALLPAYLCAALMALKEQVLAADSLSALWRVLYHQVIREAASCLFCCCCCVGSAFS